jgi:diaminopimelate decarboxylase
VIQQLNRIDWNTLTQSDRPFFLYLKKILDQSLKDLKVLLNNCTIFYSVKSNPNIHLIKWLDPLVNGYDISSHTELIMLLKLGISPDRISFSGPGKTDTALNLANKNKIRLIHIDSHFEFEFLRSQKQSTQWTLRLSSSQTIAAKLGFTIDEAKKVLSTELQYSFSGLHSYLGRESFSPKLLNETCMLMHDLKTEFPNAFRDDSQIYIGPGLPMAIKNIEPVFSNLSPYLKLSPANRLINFEIGRSLIGPCGFYGVRVLTKKITDTGRTLVIVEGGLQHLGSPLQTFRDHQNNISALLIRDGKIIETQDIKSVTIYGSLCLWHDCLVAHIELPTDIKKNDWLVFNNCGAYGLTAGVTHFIGQTLPNEFGLDDNENIVNLTNQSFRSYLEYYL